jgi:hypothetical protein
MTAVSADKHGAYAPRLLDEVRARIRAKHYSLRTEQAICIGSSALSFSMTNGILGIWGRRRSSSSSQRLL